MYNLIVEYLFGKDLIMLAFAVFFINCLIRGAVLKRNGKSRLLTFVPILGEYNLFKIAGYDFFTYCLSKSIYLLVIPLVAQSKWLIYVYSILSVILYVYYKFVVRYKVTKKTFKTGNLAPVLAMFEQNIVWLILLIFADDNIGNDTTPQEEKTEKQNDNKKTKGVLKSMISCFKELAFFTKNERNKVVATLLAITLLFQVMPISYSYADSNNLSTFEFHGFEKALSGSSIINAKEDLEYYGLTFNKSKTKEAVITKEIKSLENAGYKYIEGYVESEEHYKDRTKNQTALKDYLVCYKFEPPFVASFDHDCNEFLVLTRKFSADPYAGRDGNVFSIEYLNTDSIDYRYWNSCEPLFFACTECSRFFVSNTAVLLDDYSAEIRQMPYKSKSYKEVENQVSDYNNEDSDEELNLNGYYDDDEELKTLEESMLNDFYKAYEKQDKQIANNALYKVQNAFGSAQVVADITEIALSIGIPEAGVAIDIVKGLSAVIIATNSFEENGDSRTTAISKAVYYVLKDYAVTEVMSAVSLGLLSKVSKVTKKMGIFDNYSDDIIDKATKILDSKVSSKKIAENVFEELKEKTSKIIKKSVKDNFTGKQIVNEVYENNNINKKIFRKVITDESIETAIERKKRNLLTYSSIDGKMYKELRDGLDSGDAGERALAKIINGVDVQNHKSMNVTFKDSKTGKIITERRIIDHFDERNQIAYESKVGYVTKSSFVRKQIAKDIELLKTRQLNKVEWHFFRSSKTGKCGPSKALEKYLEDNGIKVVIHDYD